jgi:hypothetical protein
MCKFIFPPLGPVKVRETWVHFDVLSPSLELNAFPLTVFHALVLFTTIQKFVAVPSLTHTPTL